MFPQSTPRNPADGIDIGRFNLMDDAPTGVSMTDHFLAFDRRNPGFYPLLVAMAEQFVQATGRNHCGIQRLIEVARHDVDMALATADEFRINNNLGSFYSRKIMAENVHLRGLFRPRRADEADVWLYATYGREIGDLVLGINSEDVAA